MWYNLRTCCAVWRIPYSNTNFLRLYLSSIFIRFTKRTRIPQFNYWSFYCAARGSLIVKENCISNFCITNLLTYFTTSSAKQEVDFFILIRKRHEKEEKFIKTFLMIFLNFIERCNKFSCILFFPLILLYRRNQLDPIATNNKSVVVIFHGFSAFSL